MACDLVDHIKWASLECLNEDKAHVVVNALKPGYRESKEVFLQSDGDEQLLIHIPFNQTVKLSSLSIQGQGPNAPKGVKLFINKPSLGFSEAASDPPTAAFTFAPEELCDGRTHPLKAVKFKTVSTLSIFVEDNQEHTEQTTITSIRLFGTPGQTFDVAAIKKQGEEQE